GRAAHRRRSDRLLWTRGRTRRSRFREVDCIPLESVATFVPSRPSPSHSVAGSRSRSRFPVLSQRPNGLARREPMRRIARSSALLSGLACLLLSSSVFGQTFQGGLRGAVRDANGVIPGVEVMLVNDATNNTRMAVTNAAGEYAYVAVEPGAYTVRAALSGFKTYERKGLTIGTQQFITLDLTLEVGALEETVTVTGAAPLIETSNASTGEVLDQKTL